MDFLLRQIRAFLFSASDLIGLMTQFAGAGWRERRWSESRGPVWKRLVLMPVNLLVMIFWGIVWIVLLPLRAIPPLLTSSPRDLLYGFPALLVFAAVSVLVLRVGLAQADIERSYRNAGIRAVREGDFGRAKTMYSRLVSDFDSDSQEDRFNWALAMLGDGDAAQGNAILDSLAPEDRLGYPKAHRRKALLISNGLAGTQTDPEVLKKLRHHLERSGDKDSPEINGAWAGYYLAVGNEELALEAIFAAAKANPLLLLAAADVSKQAGDMASRNRALRMAREAYAAAVDKDPLDHRFRIMLAKVSIEEEKFDEAEQVLLKGVQLQPNELIGRAVAEYYVLRHDRSAGFGIEFSEQFRYLQAALKHDPNYPPIYERLISQYRARQGGGEASELRKVLEGAIASGGTPALAHFALSNLLWIDGDVAQAEWHVQQAYRLDPKFALIGNNLAWILAHKEPPELDNALELARSVVALVPTEPRFRDTLATILMLRGENEAAITEFEKTLESIRDKKTVHRNLATLYERIGNTGMANVHREMALPE